MGTNNIESILDTHIHLFPASEIDQLAWQTPDGPLNAQHSLDEYTRAVTEAANLSDNDVVTSSETTVDFRDLNAKPQLRGFVFVETDRISSLDPGGWRLALNEISYLRRVALGEQRSGEGHRQEHAHLCKGIVPWAPVPAGAQKLGEYRELAREVAGEACGLIKGWRYLLQNKENGTMLQDLFIEGMLAIGEWGEVFELGIDYHRRGSEQLREVEACLQLVYDKARMGRQVKVVINHMCKPKMYSLSIEPTWAESIRKLAAFPDTYMKLSGGFSELLPLSPEMSKDERLRAYDQATDIIHKHMDIVWEAFGAQRCMYGSDWPVCNTGLGAIGKQEYCSWKGWTDLTYGWAGTRGLSNKDKKNLFGDVAARVYGIQ